MRNKLFILILMGLLLQGLKTTAQVDPHFSQYYAYPLYLNPAMTGIIEGDYRATAIYRNQWNSFGNPYSTVGVSADMTTRNNLNIGINVFNQTAGDGGYKYLQASFSLAYSGLQLDAAGYKRVLIGMQMGWINRRFDPAKLKFGDQWMPGIGFDESTPTTDFFDKTSASSFDAAAGIVYTDGNPENKANVYGGFSVNHLTQPKDPFLTGGKEKLPMRYTIHGGVKFYVNENMIVTPNVIYMQQGNATETMAGAYLQMKAGETTDVMAGLNYRFNDAVAPYAGLYFNNVLIGVSYDVNASSISKSVKTTNALELSLTITGKRPDTDNSYMCPPRF